MTGSPRIAPAHPSGAGLIRYANRRFVLPVVSVAAAGAAMVVLATRMDDEMLDYGVGIVPVVVPWLSACLSVAVAVVGLERATRLVCRRVDADRRPRGHDRVVGRHAPVRCAPHRGARPAAVERLGTRPAAAPARRRRGGARPGAAGPTSPPGAVPGVSARPAGDARQRCRGGRSSSPWSLRWSTPRCGPSGRWAGRSARPASRSTSTLPSRGGWSSSDRCWWPSRSCCSSAGGRSGPAPCSVSAASWRGWG